MTVDRLLRNGNPTAYVDSAPFVARSSHIGDHYPQTDDSGPSPPERQPDSLPGFGTIRSKNESHRRSCARAGGSSFCHYAACLRWTTSKLHCTGQPQTDDSGPFSPEQQPDGLRGFGTIRSKNESHRRSYARAAVSSFCRYSACLRWTTSKLHCTGQPQTDDSGPFSPEQQPDGLRGFGTIRSKNESHRRSCARAGGSSFCHYAACLRWTTSKLHCTGQPQTDDSGPFSPEQQPDGLRGFGTIRSKNESHRRSCARAGGSSFCHYAACLRWTASKLHCTGQPQTDDSGPSPPERQPDSLPGFGTIRSKNESHRRSYARAAVSSFCRYSACLRWTTSKLHCTGQPQTDDSGPRSYARAAGSSFCHYAACLRWTTSKLHCTSQPQTDDSGPSPPERQPDSLRGFGTIRSKNESHRRSLRGFGTIRSKNESHRRSCARAGGSSFCHYAACLRWTTSKLHCTGQPQTDDSGPSPPERQPDSLRGFGTIRSKIESHRRSYARAAGSRFCHYAACLRWTTSKLHCTGQPQTDDSGPSPPERQPDSLRGFGTIRSKIESHRRSYARAAGSRFCHYAACLRWTTSKLHCTGQPQTDDSEPSPPERQPDSLRGFGTIRSKNESHRRSYARAAGSRFCRYSACLRWTTRKLHCTGQPQTDDSEPSPPEQQPDGLRGFGTIRSKNESHRRSCARAGGSSFCHYAACLRWTTSKLHCIDKPRADDSEPSPPEQQPDSLRGFGTIRSKSESHRRSYARAAGSRFCRYSACLRRGTSKLHCIDQPRTDDSEPSPPEQQPDGLRGFGTIHSKSVSHRRIGLSDSTGLSREKSKFHCIGQPRTDDSEPSPPEQQPDSLRDFGTIRSKNESHRRSYARAAGSRFCRYSACLRRGTSKLHCIDQPRTDDSEPSPPEQQPDGLRGFGTIHSKSVSHRRIGLSDSTGLSREKSKFHCIGQPRTDDSEPSPPEQQPDSLRDFGTIRSKNESHRRSYARAAGSSFCHYAACLRWTTSKLHCIGQPRADDSEPSPPEQQPDSLRGFGTIRSKSESHRRSYARAAGSRFCRYSACLRWGTSKLHCIGQPRTDDSEPSPPEQQPDSGRGFGTIHSKNESHRRSYARAAGSSFCHYAACLRWTTSKLHCTGQPQADDSEPSPPEQQPDS
ncbi:hypothetical protein GN958_ATG09341 [Phytophthora infestans]|uniref:Uncharacterized protein n=1 Tax=Phytophthora infestans TaxID=4787 RepID=A0A8S9UTD9_PHYIN|nr:hypothetical protein GN958_ATG09341 [Phytophthora infestans]